MKIRRQKIAGMFGKEDLADSSRRGMKPRTDSKEGDLERERYGKTAGKRGTLQMNRVITPHSHPSLLPCSSSVFISLPVGAAYVFRCTAGCTAANGLSNIFLSALPALLFARFYALFPCRPLSLFLSLFPGVCPLA